MNRCHVLLVEDNPGDARLIQEMLSDVAPFAFTLTRVDCLTAGYQALVDGPVDAILLDLSLPDSTGLNTVERMVAAAPTTPIVVLTGLEDDELGTAAVASGAQDYLIKDQLQDRLLVHALRYAIERQRLVVELEHQRRRQQASEARLLHLITSMVDGILVVDQHETIRFANAAARGFLDPDQGDSLEGMAFDLPLVSGEVVLVAVEHRPVVAEMRTLQTEWEDQPAHLIVLRDVTERKRAEADLQQLALQIELQARTLDQVLTTIPDYIFMFDAAGHIIFVNRAGAQALGASQDSLRGKTWQEVGFSEVLAAFEGEQFGVWQTLEAQQVFPAEAELEFLLSPIYNLTGEIETLVCTIHDITERRRAEQAERAQRVLSEALRDTAAAINSTLDLDEVLNRILQDLERVVPHDAADVMLIEGGTARIVKCRGYAERGLETQVLALSLDIERIPNIQRLVQTGQPQLIPDTTEDPAWEPFAPSRWIRSHVAAPIRREGQVIGLLNLDSATPRFFNQGHVERLLAFADQAAIAIENARLYKAVRSYAMELEARVVDRTAALARTTKRVEAILNNTSDAIVVADMDGHIIQVNPAFFRMFGYDAETILGSRLCRVAGPEHCQILRDVMGKLATNGETARLELVACKQDGTLFDADMVFSPPSALGSDAVPTVVCSIRDITQRKQMEENLRAALVRERELSALKSRFVSMVSHEFRTPLATIQSSNGLLRDYGDRLSEEKKHFHLNRINQQVRRLTILLDDILTMSQMQTVGLEFKPAPLDLLALAHEVSDEYRLSLPPNLVFEAAVPDHCPVVEMDGKLMRYVLNNLLSNAIKYSPDGGNVRLEITCDAGAITIRVSDQGIGIQPKDIARLFDAFHRGSNVGTIKGTGLGLTITQKAIELHRGTLDVESEPGVGTCFTVVLPVEQGV